MESMGTWNRWRYTACKQIAIFGTGHMGCMSYVGTMRIYIRGELDPKLSVSLHFEIKVRLV
jgi:hypothetical protein